MKRTIVFSYDEKKFQKIVEKVKHDNKIPEDKKDSLTEIFKHVLDKYLGLEK